ncbi:MAG: hypothetical protein ACJ74G_09135 [Blastocatellia bacterium]
MMNDEWGDRHHAFIHHSSFLIPRLCLTVVGETFIIFALSPKQVGLRGVYQTTVNEETHCAVD